jgi:hypothetical protein
LPPVTIAVGRGKPVGVGSSTNGVQIGLEALCATNYLNPNVEDRFVHVIAHEYAHVQQVPALVDDENATVLEGSLNEGAAEERPICPNGSTTVRPRNREISVTGSATVSSRPTTNMPQTLARPCAKFWK